MKEECIKIKSEDVAQLVVLENISSMEVMVTNPHLQRVSFE
jgi:hypothetical protein